MGIISDDRISVQQFKHFKKSITKALDKKLALNKSFKISDQEYYIKYPFISELQETVSKTTTKIEQIDEMSVILNNYFNTAWKEEGQKSIKLKRNFEKDLEKILFLIYSKNDLLIKGLDPMKVKYNKLEDSLTYTNRKIDNSYQEIIGLKEIAKRTNQNIIEVTKETKKNKSDFNKGFNEVKEKINQNKADSNKKFKETNNEISKIKDNSKQKNKKKVLPVHFSTFFVNSKIFNKVCTLLIENNFYGNNLKPKPVEICILIYKLDTLKIIDIYRKQSEICKSSALFFNIEEFNASNMSTIIKSFQTEIPIEAHSASIKKLKYLNQLVNKT